MPEARRLASRSAPQADLQGSRGRAARFWNRELGRRYYFRGAGLPAWSRISNSNSNSFACDRPRYDESDLHRPRHPKHLRRRSIACARGSGTRPRWPAHGRRIPGRRCNRIRVWRPKSRAVQLRVPITESLIRARCSSIRVLPIALRPFPMTPLFLVTR
jgi:hypothetical protein